VGAYCKPRIHNLFFFTRPLESSLPSGARGKGEEQRTTKYEEPPKSFNELIHEFQIDTRIEFLKEFDPWMWLLLFDVFVKPLIKDDE